MEILIPDKKKIQALYLTRIMLFPHKNVTLIII